MAKFEPIQKYRKAETEKEIAAARAEGYTIDKENYVLDNGQRIKIDLYKGTDFDDAVDFLEANGTAAQKKEFKKNCFLAVKKAPSGKMIKHKNGKETPEMVVVKDANGDPVMETTSKLNWLYAKQKFFEAFAPEYLPKAKEKPGKKSNRIANW